MFHIDIIQTRWVLLALFGGLALVLGMVLVYLANWTPRQTDAKESSDTHGGWLPLRMAFPWFLILLYVGLGVWAVLYTIRAALTPPNW